MAKTPEKKAVEGFKWFLDRVRNEHEIEKLKDRINKLQEELEMEKRLRQNLNSTLKQKETKEEISSEKIVYLPPVEGNFVGISQSELGDLVFGIAHQVRNPVSIAKSNVQMLLESARIDADEKMQLEIVLKQLLSLELRLEQLKLLSQPLQPILRLYSVADLIEKMRAILSERCREQKVQIEFSSENLELLFVKADEKLMVEAFLNIGVNAIEAMSAGGALEITIAEKFPPQNLTIVFRDSGSGMSPETLANVGKPFFTTKRDSVGIGIARTRRIVSAHSGTLNFKSSPGNGTVVSLTLPIADRVSENDL